MYHTAKQIKQINDRLLVLGRRVGTVCGPDDTKLGSKGYYHSNNTALVISDNFQTILPRQVAVVII